VLDAEDLLGLGHLPSAYLRQVPDDLRVILEPGVEHVTALAAGAGDHQHIGALGDVARHRRSALARLVVGVGMHGHQPQSLRHVALWSI